MDDPESKQPEDCLAEKVDASSPTGDDDVNYKHRIKIIGDAFGIFTDSPCFCMLPYMYFFSHFKLILAIKMLFGIRNWMNNSLPYGTYWNCLKLQRNLLLLASKEPF